MYNISIYIHSSPFPPHCVANTPVIIVPSFTLCCTCLTLDKRYRHPHHSCSKLTAYSSSSSVVVLVVVHKKSNNNNSMSRGEATRVIDKTITLSPHTNSDRGREPVETFGEKKSNYNIIQFWSLLLKSNLTSRRIKLV